MRPAADEFRCSRARFERTRRGRWALEAGLVVLLVASLAAPGYGLDPKKALTQYTHRLWRSEDGLPQNTIFSIAQTRDGLL
ncbi:MAG: hypothetical protein AAF657_34495, partial [Acidobacteriota bacterium]